MSIGFLSFPGRSSSVPGAPGCSSPDLLYWLQFNTKIIFWMYTVKNKQNIHSKKETAPPTPLLFSSWILTFLLKTTRKKNKSNEGTNICPIPSHPARKVKTQDPAVETSRVGGPRWKPSAKEEAGRSARRLPSSSGYGAYNQERSKPHTTSSRAASLGDSTFKIHPKPDCFSQALSPPLRSEFLPSPAWTSAVDSFWSPCFHPPSPSPPPPPHSLLHIAARMIYTIF